MTDVIEIDNYEDFKATVANGETVVKFWATWCGPCKQFAPHFEKAAENTTDVTFVSVDIDKVPEAVSELSVMSVPTVKRFRDGNYEGDVKARTVVALLNELK